MISLVVISGRSGSGKSTALHVLEDMGHYCIDNLPITLLQPLLDRLSMEGKVTRAAVSIDARNTTGDLSMLETALSHFDKAVVDAKVVYLDAGDSTLMERFSETRRKHPLSDLKRGLRESLELETKILGPVSSFAELRIDTTSLTMHELRDQIRTRVARESREIALLFLSFAYKRGIPGDADIVFDVRCLPNPYWKPDLRYLTGLDGPVQRFLLAQQEFKDTYDDIERYLARQLPGFEASNRSYLTVAIGCTGGQHRSVVMCNRLFEHFKSSFENVQVRHRELASGESSRAPEEPALGNC